MSTRVCIFLILLFSGHRIDAAIIFYDNHPFASAGLIDTLYRQSLLIQDSLMAIRSNASKLEIVEINNEPYLLVDGRMNVFSFSNGKWQDISKSAYHGYNFNSKKFISGDTIYSFGGYGFWRMHGDLSWFDLDDRREWELVPIDSDHDIGNGITFTQKGKLYVIHPESNNQAIGFPVLREGMFEIDLATGKLSHYNIAYNPSRTSNFNLESDSFLLIYASPLTMIRKRDLAFRMSTLTYAEQLSNSGPQSLIVISGNKILFKKDTATTEVQYDLASVYNELDGEEKPLIKSPISKAWFALLIVPFVLSYLYFFRKGRSKPETPVADPLINELLEHKGKVLDQDQLDAIFRITDIRTSETLRGKRAQLIKKLNDEYRSSFGHPLIVRIPDPKDNRRNLYQIGMNGNNLIGS